MEAAEPTSSADALVMVLIVRDEADILETNLRYHHALGVGRFIVTDNGSTDGTREILERYAAAGLLHVIDEPGSSFAQNERDWLTRMARMAATEHGADWVIYGDADEFWLPAQGSLRDVLGSVPDRYGALVAPRTEFVGRSGGSGDFPERLTIRELRSRVQPKLAHRAEPDVVSVDRGGHLVSVAGASGDVENVLRPPGRPVHRVVRDLGEEDRASRPEDETRLVWAPMWPIRILHFPVRSLAQFRRRAEIAVGDAYPDTGVFARLRREHEEGRLQELYEAMVLDDEQVEQGIRDGILTRDERLRDLLARCPDPLSGVEPGTVRATLEGQALERELSELEFDAMQLLGRAEGWLVMQRNRKSDRIEQLRRQKERLIRKKKLHTGQRDSARRRSQKLRRRLLDRRQRVKLLREKLRAERARPWSRMRRAVGRALGRGGRGPRKQRAD